MSTHELYLAAQNGHLSVVQNMVASGAHVNAIHGAMYLAVNHGHFAIAQWLAEEMNAAAQEAHLDLEDWLFKNGATNLMDCMEQAVQDSDSNHLNVVDWLAFGATNLMDAMERAVNEGNHLHVCVWLVANGAIHCIDDLDEIEMALNRALCNAVVHGHLAMVKWLESNGGSIEAWKAALTEAASHGHLNIVKFLVCNAVLHGHLAMVKWLESNGGSIEAWKAALTEAASHGHLNIVKFLVRGDTRGGGEDALVEAVFQGHLGIAMWLATHGAADIDEAFRCAAALGHLDIVQWLAANGATDLDGALDPAASGDHPEIMQWLCDNGASTDTVTFNGAMNSAAQHGQLEAVKWLAINGATDLAGARFNAEQGGYSEIVRFINVFRGCQAFGKAVRAWLIVNYWTKQVGERQYAPTAPGGKRYIAELQHVGEQAPELVMVEALGELGVLSTTKGKRPRFSKCHNPASMTFDCGDCGSCVIDCVDCNTLICTGCDEDFGCDA